MGPGTCKYMFTCFQEETLDQEHMLVFLSEFWFSVSWNKYNSSI